MNPFLSLLRLLPWALVVASQLLALIALRGELVSRRLPLARVGVPVVGYVLALVLGVVSLVAALRAWPHATLWLLAAALCVCLAPLLWGRAVGEFHLSHHLVRLGIVVVAGVLLTWFVTSHR